MGIRLKADPAQLQQASSKMNDIAAQYQSSYKALTNAVQNLVSSGWTGTDAQQFSNKVMGFEDDFNNMYMLLMGASNDLKESAQKYSTTQDNAKSRAASLRDSI